MTQVFKDWIVSVFVLALTFEVPASTLNGVPPVSRLPMMIVVGPIEFSIEVVTTLREDPTGLHAGGDSKLVVLDDDVVTVVDDCANTT